MKSLEQFVENVVSASTLKKESEKMQLRKELHSHLYAEKKELELQGYNEERVIKTIETKFGNIQTIGRELFFVHRVSKTLLTELRILLLIIVIMCALLFSRFVFIIFKPFL